MISQGRVRVRVHVRTYMRYACARIGDVIEPAALRRNVAYREFFNTKNFRVK